VHQTDPINKDGAQRLIVAKSQFSTLEKYPFLVVSLPLNLKKQGAIWCINNKHIRENQITEFKSLREPSVALRFGVSLPFDGQEVL
jgi:hypothetical protein